MATLLTLPTEIRTQIWTFLFSNLDITPEEPFDPSVHHCSPCWTNKLSTQIAYSLAVSPLLTCKQIYHEGMPLLLPTSTIHLSCPASLASILGKHSSLLPQIVSLTLYLHLTEENRQYFSDLLAALWTATTSLKQLSIHNHMRPPMNYEHLMDALYFASPLIKANITHREINVNIQFDYIIEDVMFESPFLGEIRCSDALEEHSAVVRDLISDKEFAEAVRSQRDQEERMDVMTARLVAIARRYEQPWFQRLQRRRLEVMNRELAEQSGTSEGSTAGQDGSQDGSQAGSS